MSIQKLKLLQCKASDTKTLPIGLNRISWKHKSSTIWNIDNHFTLPIGLNRISWKQPVEPPDMNSKNKSSLPIGLNRISWKQLIAIHKECTNKIPYRLG